MSFEKMCWCPALRSAGTRHHEVALREIFYETISSITDTVIEEVAQ